MLETARTEEAPVIDRISVENVFRNLNQRKAAGPDNIKGILLKTCAK